MKKRVLSILASVCMVLTMAAGFSTDVSAAPDSMIQDLTINKLEPGVQVDVYKIIDLNVDEEGHYGETVYKWTDKVNGWLANNNNATYKSYIDVDKENAVTDTYIDLNKNDDESYGDVPDMSNAVTAFIQDMAAQIRTSNVQADHTVTTTGESVTVNELTMGSYLVLAKGATDSSNIYYATVHNVLPTEEFTLAANATIEMKHKPVTIEKEATDPSVHVGEEVTYTITTDIPTYPENVDEIHYVIGDKLSEGLTFNPDSVVVKVSDGNIDTNLTADVDYTLDTTENENYTFTVTITNKDVLVANATKQIKVTYTATVNEDAIVTPDNLKNDARLEFNTDPFNTNDYTTITTEEDVYTYNIDLTKVGTGEGDVDGLEGAKFKLMDEDKTTTYKFKTVDGAYVLDVKGSEELVSGENGKLVIKGLDAGTYVLKETEAPSGYITPNGEITIKLTDEDNNGILDDTADATGGEITDVDKTTDTLTLAFKLTNKKVGDLDLPVTGGMGTMIFTLGGLIVMSGAVYLFVRSRKNSQNK